MARLLPSLVFKVLDNPLGIGLVQLRHWLKHRRQLKCILNRHDSTVLYTEANRQELQHFVGHYKKDYVGIIPNPVTEVFQGPLQKEKYILHVGRLNVQQKRSDLLLDFWEKTYPRLPDWEFVIVGDGPYKKTLEEEIEKKALPRIKLKGFQDPAPYFKQAPIFIMPSAYEGFPNVLPEAQSFGAVPVAFYSYGALPYIINEDVDGCLIEAYNVETMSNKIVQLAGDHDKLANMQQAALTNAERFTLEKVGKQWAALFQRLSGNGSSS
jgi:glycosyltransferase involved in cell wall biosynthesis